MTQLSIRTVVALNLALLAGLEARAADWKVYVEWNLLTNDLGAAMPVGTNITVSQIEGEVAVNNYFPNTNDLAFDGKYFYDRTGTHVSNSYHATTVGSNLYGLASAAPGIGYIDVYMNSHWMGDGFLWPASGGDPLTETNRIQNHCWVGTSSVASDYIRRLDYAIDRDGFTCVVGLANTTNPIPELLGYTYNGITVGRLSGVHSTGPTTNDVAGRVKPDLIAPGTYTSWAVPMVSGGAALLMDTSDSFSWTNGSRPQTIKALLMAGATKAEFGTNWDRTFSRPLDERYGAGELNIYNSWHILTNGEQNASETSLVSHVGWDYEELSAATSRWYFFDVPTNHAPSRFSTILTWHRKITDGNPGPQFSPDAFVANLDLFLYQAENFLPTNLVDHSTSQVDNVEHIFQTTLPGGRYALKVASDDEAKYALAWYKAPAAIPAIGEASYLSPTGFVITVGVSPYVLYGISATSNLLDSASWTNIVMATPKTSLWTFVDAKATNFSCRYYRAFVDPE